MISVVHVVHDFAVEILLVTGVNGLVIFLEQKFWLP